MAAAMLQGALAANLSLTNVPFTLSSKTVAAPGGIAAALTTVDTGKNTTATSVGIPKAGLDGICVHAAQKIGLPVVGDLGTWSLNISSPEAKTPLTTGDLASGKGLQANKLVLDAQAVKAAQAKLNASESSPNVIGAAADSPTMRGAASRTASPASSAWTPPAASPTSGTCTPTPTARRSPEPSPCPTSPSAWRTATRAAEPHAATLRIPAQALRGHP
ncbi:hypothetical protein ACFQVA_01515 [Actinomadura keratinilytica]